jgi:spermidine/putrescine-binding protein
LRRREFLRLAVGSAAALALPNARTVGATPGSTAVGTPGPSASPVPPPPGELRLLTSADHWDPGVIRTLAARDGIRVRVDPLWDDAEAHRRVVAREVTPDLVTADGGWITRYRADDLVSPIEIRELAIADELFPMAFELEPLVAAEGLLGVPWSWSVIQVVCDPARVSAGPDWGFVRVDPRYRGGVVTDAQRLDLVLCAARATGAADPLAMTDAELGTATEWLTRLRPNVRHIARTRGEVIERLASGECTLAISALGVPDLVRDVGGPELVAFVPREGSIGSLEAELALRSAPNAERIPAWLDAADAAEVAAESFLRDGRPLFNERALQLLIDSGHGDRARRYLYDRPETVAGLLLTGPGERPDAYLAAWATGLDVEA